MTNRFFSGQTDYIEQLNALDGETADHIADTTGAHAATAISNTPAGNIAATTVQAAINELDGEKLSASAATLPSSFVNASLNSIVPTGGTLNVFGAVTLSGGTANSVAYLNASKEVTTSSDLFFDGSTFRVAGDIAAVGNGARFSIYRDTGINYLDWADGQDLYLSTQISSGGSGRSTKAVFGTDGSLLINQTTNPSNYKLAVTGNVGVTGAINATGTIASSNALETLNSGSLYQYNAGSTTFFRSRNDGNNLDVSYNGGGVITRTNTSGFAVTGNATVTGALIANTGGADLLANGGLRIYNAASSALATLRFNAGVATLDQPLSITGALAVAPQTADTGLVVTGASGIVNQKVDIQLSDGGGAYSYARLRFGADDILTWGRALSSYADVLRIASPNGNVVIGAGESDVAAFSTTGLSVTGLTTTDTLRVNVTPTAETPTATHTAVFNINGTNYKFLCLVA